MTHRRAVIYLRVSSKEQVENYSLDTQERGCREWCARHGFEVAAVFREEGETGKSTERRVALQALLRFVARQGADVAVVLNVKRFARNQGDHFAISGKLALHGCKLRSVEEPLIGEETPSSVIMEGLSAALAHADNLDRSIRTREGMKAAIAAGRWPWQAPVGYLHRERELHEDPQTAPFVRRAFELAAAGASGPEVVAQLRAAGFRVALESLHRLISNPLYRGRVVADRWGLDVAGRHKPLVDDETFRRAQRLRRFGRDVDAPRAYVTGSTERFPFRAVTRCSGCDASLTAYRVKARFDYYRCAACRTLAPAKSLEAGFLRLLEGMAVKPSVIDLAAELAAERAGVIEAQGTELATAARRRAATARQRLERLRRAYLDDQAFDAETFKAEQARLTGELQEAESAAAAPNPLARIKPRLEAIRHWLQTPVLLWDAVPASRRAALVRRAFPAGLRWDHGAKNLTATKSLLFLPLTPLNPGPNGKWYPQDGDSQTADLALPAWLTEFEGLLLEVAPCVSGSSPFSSLPC